MTKPIRPIARIASLNGAASVEGVTAGNIRPRRVHRGKSPVTGGEDTLFFKSKMRPSFQPLLACAPRPMTLQNAPLQKKQQGYLFKVIEHDIKIDSRSHLHRSLYFSARIWYNKGEIFFAKGCDRNARGRGQRNPFRVQRIKRSRQRHESLSRLLPRLHLLRLTEQMLRHDPRL